MLAACLTIVACAAPEPPVSPAVRPEPQGTRYHLGDFVVYRYDGSFTQTPVTMREEITAQEGKRLRIDVTVTRGSDERKWAQVVTDTPENQRANVVDALFEWQGGKFVRLENAANADLLRLYGWVLVVPDGRPTEVKSESCKKTIGGVDYTCTCTGGRNTINGAAVTFSDSECSDFVWTHGPSVFRDVANASDVLRADIIAAGHDAGAQPQPLMPVP
ncbi:hypothetical protein BH09MYX1_BH09MYX1_45240 [soil metagenome]